MKRKERSQPTRWKRIRLMEAWTEPLSWTCISARHSALLHYLYLNDLVTALGLGRSGAAFLYADFSVAKHWGLAALASHLWEIHWTSLGTLDQTRRLMQTPVASKGPEEDSFTGEALDRCTVCPLCAGWESWDFVSLCGPNYKSLSLEFSSNLLVLLLWELFLLFEFFIVGLPQTIILIVD